MSGHTAGQPSLSAESGRRGVSEQDAALAEVHRAVTRYVRGRTDVDAEDVVQEAMTRLLENRDRLEQGSWGSYAVVSAGNLLRDRERSRAVWRRHAHRLHVPDSQASAEDEVLTAEEHHAVRRAMGALDEPAAGLLSEHYLRQQRSNRSLAPSAAARLARARAKLRVAYVLEQAGAHLPTARCRPVLEAVSTGDRRRQERLGAARHLLTCRACATHAPALVERRRALAGLNPLGWVVLAAGALWAAARRRPGQAAAASGTLALAAVVTTAALAGQDPAPRPAPAGPRVAPSAVVLVDGRPVLPRSGSSAVPLGAARGQAAPVQAVAADEGFWVGTGPGQRLWVQVVGAGESALQVRAGDVVSFQGRAVRLPPGGARRLGLTAEEGSGELQELGVYLRVPRGALAVRRP